MRIGTYFFLLCSFTYLLGNFYTQHYLYINWTDDQLHKKRRELCTHAYSIGIGYTLYPMEDIIGKVAWFLGRLRIPTFNQLSKSQPSKGVLNKTFILWFCERSDVIFVPWKCLGPHTFSVKLNLSGYYSISFYFQSLGLHQIIVHLP